MRKIFLSVTLLISSITLASAQGLTKEQANETINRLLKERSESYIERYGDEWDSRELINGKHKMKFYYKTFGDKPADGRAMYISMHGGGGAPAHVNDKQWNNQKSLYQAKEGLYFVPRAPTDTWNMWHQGYMDGFIEKAILMAVINEGVNPNKVYIMGYSAGGDGTYQLAPRLADLWAAAAMSAGHPGNAHIENLRNLPFGLYMGAKDTPYDRNKHAATWGNMLDSLAAADEGAYIHDVRIFAQHGHWMQRDDAISMEWMPKHTRNSIPEKIVWKQDDVLRDRFYWLEAVNPHQNDELVVSYKDNKIFIEKSNINTFIIGLNDNMMNLDKKIKVYKDGKVIFKGNVERLESNIKQDIDALRDKDLIFPAKIKIQL